MAHFTSLKRTDDETKQQVQATRARNVVREGPKWYGAEHKKDFSLVQGCFGSKKNICRKHVFEPYDSQEARPFVFQAGGLD